MRLHWSVAMVVTAAQERRPRQALDPPATEPALLGQQLTLNTIAYSVIGDNGVLLCAVTSVTSPSPAL
jgi:hypothetical protein